MLSTGLESESGLAPRSNRTGTTDGGLTFTTAVRMVAGVHYGTAYCGTDAHVTGTACFTDLNVDVVLVAYGTDGSHTFSGNVSEFAGGKTEESIFAFLSHELSSIAGSSCKLTAASGIKLYVVNERTGGDVGKGKRVADLDIGVRSGNDGVAYCKTCGSEDVALNAVFVLNECDKRGTIGIVLYGLNFGSNVEFLSLEVNYTILFAVSAAVMTNGDSAVAVSAGGLLDRFKKASFGSNL